MTYKELYNKVMNIGVEVDKDSCTESCCFGALYRIVNTKEMIYDVALMNKDKEVEIMPEVRDDHILSEFICKSHKIEVAKEKYVIDPKFSVGYFMNDIIKHICLRYNNAYPEYIDKYRVAKDLIINIEYSNLDVYISVTSRLHSDFMPFNFKIECTYK